MYLITVSFIMLKRFGLPSKCFGPTWYEWGRGVGSTPFTSSEFGAV